MPYSPTPSTLSVVFNSKFVFSILIHSDKISSGTVYSCADVGNTAPYLGFICTILLRTARKVIIDQYFKIVSMTVVGIAVSAPHKRNSIICRICSILSPGTCGKNAGRAALLPGHCYYMGHACGRFQRFMQLLPLTATGAEKITELLRRHTESYSASSFGTINFSFNTSSNVMSQVISILAICRSICTLQGKEKCHPWDMPWQRHVYHTNTFAFCHSHLLTYWQDNVL